MNFDYIFPTTIYHGIMEEHQDDKQRYLNRISSLRNEIDGNSDWNSSGYSSFGKHRLNNDIVFLPLMESCMLYVKQYADHLMCDYDDIIMTDSWFNIANYKDNQEWHIHPNSHFSMVYYLEAPENSSKIVFKSPDAVNDMYYFSVKEYTDATYKTYSYSVSDSAFIIFKSNLYHMTEPQMIEKDRISIGMNFSLLMNQ